MSANTAGRILLHLLRISLPSIVFALITASVLQIGDLYLPIANWRWVPVPLWHLDDRDSYGTLLSTIAGIGGVLIGLYYAGLTAVSSAAYAQAPGVVRNLLLREPVGKFYIRLLTYSTFVSLCLLAFYSSGFSPLRLAIPFLILLSGLTILSFVRLGEHAFYFFDPTRLAGSIFVELERWVKRATVASRFWADASFQNHANRQAESTLKALTTLTNYSAGQKQLRSEPIADLAISTVGFLYRYEVARQSIPSESKWYPLEYQHPDFYAAGDVKTEMAVQTGGSVQPISIAQSNWVEAASLPVVIRALQTNLEENNEGAVFRILDVLLDYLDRLGELWEIEKVSGIIEQVEAVIAPVSFSPESAAPDAPRWLLGLVEYTCLLPIRALLGFVKGLGNARVEKIRGSLRKLQWKRPHTLYETGFPRYAVATVEWLRPRLEFEAIAEGRVITPQWLIEQTVAKDYLNALHRSVAGLLKANERLYGSWLKKAEKANHPWAGAVVLNRQGEYIVKFRTHFDRIAANEAEYESLKVLPDMMGWPAPQASAIKQQLVAIERDYEISVAKEAYSLVGIERRPYVPDFAGEFLARTARTLLEAILRNDVLTFQQVFPLYFQASIQKTTRLLTSGEATSESEKLQRFNTAMGPLLDVLELSGYSIIVSELQPTTDFWNSVRPVWDRYVADPTSGPARMEFLRGVLQTADIPGMFAAGELIRSGWRMRIQTLFRDLPSDRVVGSAPSGIHIKQRVRHASDLVRLLAAETIGFFYRGIDVFVAMYFVRLPGNENVARELRASGLIDALNRQSRRGREAETREEPAED